MLPVQKDKQANKLGSIYPGYGTIKNLCVVVFGETILARCGENIIVPSDFVSKLAFEHIHVQPGYPVTIDSFTFLPIIAVYL